MPRRHSSQRSHAIVGASEFNNLEVKFQHQACRARIFDAKRKFQDAARHYYELSQVGKATVIAIMGAQAAQQANLDQIIEEQNVEALNKAAILRNPGARRARPIANPRTSLQGRENSKDSVPQYAAAHLHGTRGSRP